MKDVKRIRLIGKCPLCGEPCREDASRCMACIRKAANVPTVHELRILQHLVDEGSTKGAAVKVGISDKTVQFHIKRLRDKLSIPSAYSLIAWAFRAGILTSLPFVLGCHLNAVEAPTNLRTNNIVSATHTPPGQPQAAAKAKPPVQTGYITLAWDATVTPGVKFYNLYLGPQGGPYTNHTSTSQTRATLKLPKGPYQFGVSAVFTNNVESQLSNVVKWNVKPSNMP